MTPDPGNLGGSDRDHPATVPMFTVTDAFDGTRVAYEEVWQRRILLLVTMPPGDTTGAAYGATVAAHAGVLEGDDVRVIVTCDPIAGMPSPGVLVADRWGGISDDQAAARVADLPAADDIIEWLRYVQSRCPECEGEAR